MFCVECGKKGKTYHGLCIDCYLKRKKFFVIPESIEVAFCRECDAYRIGNEWRRGNFDEDLRSHIMNSIKAEIDYECIMDGMEVVCRGKFEGRDVEERKRVKMISKEKLCPECSLRKGGYFEAIIQVRDASKKIMEEVDEIIRKSAERSGSFITRKERVRGGYDYYMGNKKAAEHAVREIKSMPGVEMKMSSTLHGMKDGRRIYRDTYSLRFTSHIGKFIKLDDVLYYIAGREGKKLELRGVDGERKHVYTEDLKRAVKVDLKAREARVLYEEGNYLHVMDMENYRTVVVRKPQHWKGERIIRIVEYEGKIYAVDENV